MCGIAGIYHVKDDRPVDVSALKMMIDSLRHRGPDEGGSHVKGNIGLAHARLSIIDLAGGTQPIYNEDKTICVILNGEIFNYIELQEKLELKGHVFSTRSDTEVIVHLYEEYGNGFIRYMIGQFAIALWDEKKKQLLLVRDRVGIRPLFYSILEDGTFLFGSEMKALLSYPDLKAEIDPSGIDQIFTLWANIPPRTVFKGVNELPAAHLLSVSPEGIKKQQYWKLQFPDENDYDDKPLSDYSEKLKELLYDAVTLRLRADVPVASYLSGGIDSSIISALVKNYHNNDLITYSVAFRDANFDERSYQMEMLKYLKTDHRIIEADYENIGDAFADVVWYAEKPMIRTAPSPLYILSGLVRSDNIKVVLTGEGADEIFGGYNIFKEDKCRRFWAKFPESKMRPLLLSSLYSYIVRDSRTRSFWQSFFKKGLTDTENVFYSHLLRWRNTSHVKRFFSNEYQTAFDENRILEDLYDYIDPDIERWHPLCRAQYLEIVLFMSGYLLSSQGDRMMMGHSVEGRFPFLDHRVIEFASTVPPQYKIKTLNEKFLLKRTYADLLPDSITSRTKQPYRAPIGQCFFANNESFVSQLISREAIEASGYFNPNSVEMLLNKFSSMQSGSTASERDDMTLAGIVSMQLLHHHFISAKS